MNLISDTHVQALLKGDFENRLLRSAYARIHDYNDPLRGPVFALLMRELIRIVMDRIAPDSLVSQAPWCQGDPWTYPDQSKNTKVTRRSRYRFAITGTISDDKIKQYPKLNCQTAIDELSTLVNKLSKFAHISPGTFDLTVEQTTDFLGEVEDAVSQYARTLTTTKGEIRDIMWTIVDDSVNQHVLKAIPDELDALSGQTLVENIHIEHLQDFDTSTLTPTLTGSGVAEIELNYGHGDDHMSSGDSYPMEFEVSIDPATFEVTVESVSVDTSLFYE
jgi:hypothetical protein